MTELTWTHETPTVPGWYFMRVCLPGKPLRVLHVHKRPKGYAGAGLLCVAAIKSEHWTILQEVDMTDRIWAGPIPEPVALDPEEGKR